MMDEMNFIEFTVKCNLNYKNSKMWHCYNSLGMCEGMYEGTVRVVIFEGLNFRVISK